jgi:hypothetical protein
MTQRISTSLAICVVALAFFVAGVFVGRNSLATSGYDRVTSATEAPLLGRWKILANDGPEQWSIEFRRDRTATKYFPNGRTGLVAFWGRSGDELPLQNIHATGEETAYIPPVIFKIIQLDENRARLQGADGQVAWDLTRI